MVSQSDIGEFHSDPSYETDCLKLDVANGNFGDSKRGSLRSASCVSLTEMSCSGIEKCEGIKVFRSEIRKIYIDSSYVLYGGAR